MKSVEEINEIRKQKRKELDLRENINANRKQQNKYFK